MAEAKELTFTLGGRWYGSYGTAPCPVCQPEKRADQYALSLRDGTWALLAHCKKGGCRFGDILAAADVDGAYRVAFDPAREADYATQKTAELRKRAAQAQQGWDEARAIEGTPAERYLRDARRITCALPPTLRFHACCWHGPTATRHPALLARVDGGEGFALHRTFLRADGGGKAALRPNKMMLGAVAGGAVRLAAGCGSLVVGEGIESTLSAYILHGDAGAAAWATLSTSGMSALQLPECPGRLIIATDPDAAGLRAAQNLARRAVKGGWTVSIKRPSGKGDFNDMLLAKGEP